MRATKLKSVGTVRWIKLFVTKNDFNCSPKIMNFFYIVYGQQIKWQVTTLSAFWKHKILNELSFYNTPYLLRLIENFFNKLLLIYMSISQQYCGIACESAPECLLRRHLNAPITKQTNCVEGSFLCFRRANNKRRYATDHYYYTI